MPPYVMHVISHTHWDREWYLAFQQFRMRFVDLIDHLLEILDTDPGFKHYCLDGQTIVLEDYLEIRPEKRAVLEKHIREGRILVGPWYQLNDEFLVSGEANIRSLLIGHRIGQGFGAVMKVGYLPDQFGNISQMPQILNGFGIDNAVFGRGFQVVGDRKMEFYWDSPDGSRVLTSLMAFWYNNAQWFPSDTDEAAGYARGIRDAMAPWSAVSDLLLMNGVDHLEAQAGLPDILARANGKLDGDLLLHSSLPAYVDAVRSYVAENKPKLDVVTGELREDRGGNVLAGTLSSRIYIKQENEKTQTALEKYAEPAASFAYLLGVDYPQGFLSYAWKLLLQNHPHDSICGCSTDQVHREMIPRFEQVRQVASEVAERGLGAIAGRVSTDGDSVLVYNPLSWSRTDRVRAVIDLPAGDPTRSTPVYDESMDTAWIRLLDDSGNEVPMSVLDSELTGKQILSPVELPLCVFVRRFTVEFLAERVPSCGYATYRIERLSERPGPEANGGSLVCGGNAISNEFLRLSVRDGRVMLEQLELGKIYHDINAFEDVGDVGDEYCYIRPADDVRVTSESARPKAAVVDGGPVSASLKLEMTLKLPAGASEDRKTRSAETVDCHVTTTMTLTRGVPRVDVVTTVENRAKDHRLRVLAPTGASIDVAAAEGQFDVIERGPVPSDWEGASPFSPQQGWVDVSDGERGLCVINKGLTEYELYRDEGSRIAVTLLRCIGSLSGGCDCAPGAELTPEAQCLGEHTFEYAFYPHGGSWADARVWVHAHQHNVPMVAFQTGPHSGDLPARCSFVETSHPEMIVSAIKRAEDSGLLVVRFYNPTGKHINGAWLKVRGSIGAKLLNLNEETIGEVGFANETVTLDVAPKKIVTLGFHVAV